MPLEYDAISDTWRITRTARADIVPQRDIDMMQATYREASNSMAMKRKRNRRIYAAIFYGLIVFVCAACAVAIFASGYHG